MDVFAGCMKTEAVAKIFHENAIATLSLLLIELNKGH